MRENRSKRIARYALTIALSGIAVGYASAFMQAGPPAWAPWLLAFGIPVSLISIMILGAARDAGGIKKLAVPFLLVGLLLTGGFCLALGLAESENVMSRLYLGLPLRAAIMIYVVGLIPIVILPIAYAVTFETQTLSPEDLQKVRELGAAYRKTQAEKPIK